LFLVKFTQTQNEKFPVKLYIPGFVNMLVVRVIKLQKHFLLARRTELARESRSLITPGIRNNARRSAVMCSAIWASQELHGHHGSCTNTYC